MIVFDLDGTLANCEHRLHFVKKTEMPVCSCAHTTDFFHCCDECKFEWNQWKHNWQAFYEACDKDEIIQPVKTIFINFWDLYDKPVQIWSGRCESVRNKTQNWLSSHGLPIGSFLKMRPIGDRRTNSDLKEAWYNDLSILEGKKIDMVFEDDPSTIDMFRKHGIFVFDCNQLNKPTNRMMETNK
jgi:hypothetical protein